MEERIKELRKALGLTQQKFADALGIKQNTVAQYEIGRNPPTDTVITLICREFGVNESWLRDGIGEMFRQKTVNEELNAFFADVLNENPSAKSRLILSLSRLSDEQWDVLETVIDDLADKQKTDPK